jgi:hypothetical protein
METTGKKTHGRPRRALTTTLALALLAAALLAGAALAAGHEGPGKGAKPGKPVAKAPSGTIASTTPTFTWSKAKGAAKYELRVYESGSLLLKKSGLTGRSWKSSKALPANVDLSWKVRARGAGGLGAWSRSLKFKVVPPSPAKAITAFSFASPPATGVINETLHTIALNVPYGTNPSALVATFTTTGASVAVAGTPQVSGLTANSFTNPVTYTVTAEDGTTQAYLVTVTVAGNPAKAITAFSFASPPATGVISETLHAIALSVPYGTSLTALVATFTTTGASVAIAGTPQVSGVTANNFTNPVTYTVTAADGTSQAYVVTVTVAPGSPEKAITAFTIPGQTGPTTINETLHTITVTVPLGTDRAALTPTITITGVSVDPPSGWINNFTNPVTYTVTAQDGTTQVYLVTVAVAAPVIGQSYGGGKIAYVLQGTDEGYDANVWHGLIAATVDQSAASTWSNIQTSALGTTKTGVGFGEANTAAIVGQVVGTIHCVNGAALLCSRLSLGGYADWYLPSRDELAKLYANRAAVGGFLSGTYWSSSEYNSAWSYYKRFTDGFESWGYKAAGLRVRAVRSF